ncbi:MAG: metallophosphoesterase family protein [Merdibacter sp.]
MIILGKDGDKVKIVVVSDSHGRDDLLYDLQLQHGDADAFLHCGDVENDAESFPGYVIVQGNNDYYYDLPAERILPFGEHRILLIHSHQFPYRKREERMRAYAQERGCDIVCYEHTYGRSSQGGWDHAAERVRSNTVGTDDRLPMRSDTGRTAGGCKAHLPGTTEKQVAFFLVRTVKKRENG